MPASSSWLGRLWAGSAPLRWIVAISATGSPRDHGRRPIVRRTRPVHSRPQPPHPGETRPGHGPAGARGALRTRAHHRSGQELSDEAWAVQVRFVHRDDHVRIVPPPHLVQIVMPRRRRCAATDHRWWASQAFKPASWRDMSREGASEYRLCPGEADGTKECDVILLAELLTT